MRPSRFFNHRDERGFTLIELLIVIVTIGILAGTVVFALGGVTQQAAATACQSDATIVAAALAAYQTQTGNTGVITPSQLTSGTTPYLKSFPSSSYYTISISMGTNNQAQVMVAAPPTATPVLYTSTGACAGAGAPTTVGATTTTVGGATTTTSGTTTTLVGTTSTTSTTSTTTTSSSLPNGVVVTPTFANYNNYGGQELLNFANTGAITNMSVTITVAQTSGVTYVTQFNSFPGGAVNMNNTTSGGYITYTYNEPSNQSIPANYANGQIGAQFGGTGAVHPFTGDTWSVTTTSNGITSTQSGAY